MFGNAINQPSSILSVDCIVGSAPLSLRLFDGQNESAGPGPPRDFGRMSQAFADSRQKARRPL